MRQMRLWKREIKDPEALRKILDACDVVRIGAADREGMFIVPVNFGYTFEPEAEGIQLRLYFHGAREGRKAEAFAENPQVAIEMDCGHALISGNYTCAYSYAFQSIMGSGSVYEITEIEEKIQGLRRIMEHLAPEAGIRFSDEMLERTGVYCIEVDSFTGKERAPK